jgi:dipeptidyl aminopeptidase/acylaminoacyl peptidase
MSAIMQRDGLVPLAATAVLIWMMPLSCADAGESKRLVTPEDIAAIRWFTSPDLTPDGKTVAYVIVEWDRTDAKAERKRTLWLAATDGGTTPRRVATEHERVTRPLWSPDGRRLAFLSPGKDVKRTKQIYLAAADGSGVVRLTDGVEGIRSFQWAPDGKAIAFRAVANSNRPEGAPIEVGRDYVNARLWVVDVGTGKEERAEPRAVTKGEKHILDFAWAPDGARFAVTVAPTPALDDVFLHGALVVMDRAGKVERLLSEIVSTSEQFGARPDLAWSPDGKKIAYNTFSPKRIARRLAVIRADGGEPTYPLQHHAGTPFENMMWGSDSRWLWLQSFERTRNYVLRVDTLKGDVRRFAGDVQNFWAFAVTPDGRTMVVGGETGQMPPNLTVIQDGGKPRMLTDLNPQVAGLRLGDVREVEWKSTRDGQLINGVLVIPANFQEGKPYPMIVELHGGPQGMWWASWLGTYLSRGQYYASQGYVVFLPNPRGSIGMGEKFVEANEADWGGGDYQDVMDGIDSLIDQKIADPDRLAVGGQSYGGYLTAWTTTRTNRFRAAVVDCGVIDLETFSLTNDLAAPLRYYFGGDEIRSRKILASRSPLAHIERCKTPTLVLHGEKDERVPLYHGRAWHKGLKLLGVETEMVVYPGEGHVLEKRANQLDEMRRVLAWYDRYLKRP